MRASVLTSARFGTFLRVSRSWVRRLAIISGSAAFLAPEIDKLPLSGFPPSMLMRSMLMRPVRYCSISRKRTLRDKAGKKTLSSPCRPDCLSPGARTHVLPPTGHALALCACRGWPAIPRLGADAVPALANSPWQFRCWTWWETTCVAGSLQAGAKTPARMGAPCADSPGRNRHACARGRAPRTRRR